MRRGASRPGLVPSIIGWSLAAFVGVAAVVGVTQSRRSPPVPPAETPETASQSNGATVTAPPQPAPLPVARLSTARIVEDVPAREPASPVTSPRSAKTASKTKTEAQSRCGGATAGGPCPDVAFAALDKQVNAAFAAAMRSSATPGPLGRDQQDWIIRVDRIRREDPASAQDLYRARVTELRALASKDVDQTQAPTTQNNAESHNR